MATKGYAAAEVEQTYTRAQELCLQVGEPLQVAQVLFGLFALNTAQGNLKASLALGEQFLPVAQQQQDPTVSLVAHAIMGMTLIFLGEFTSAQVHLDQASAVHDSEQHHDLAFHMGQDLGSAALGWAAETLWYRGYPDQALEQVRHVLPLVQSLSHPLSLAGTLGQIARVHLFRRESQKAQAQAEALLVLAHQHGFALWLGWGTSLQGWALVERTTVSNAEEQRQAGLMQIREGLVGLRNIGVEIWAPLFLGALAQGYAQGGQVQEGLGVISEALALVEKNEERWDEAELYRIKGTLTLESKVASPKSKVEEAEACFLKAIEIAQKQQAKSLELRATVSLARLWHSQGKRAEAHQMLAEIYGWFTEGFGTKDLQEAKALLKELNH
jgi:predicted ATPase